MTFLVAYCLLHMRTWINLIHLAADIFAEPKWPFLAGDLLSTGLIFLTLWIYVTGGGLAIWALEAEAATFASRYPARAQSGYALDARTRNRRT